MMRSLITSVLIVAATLLGLLVILWVMQRRMIYFPLGPLLSLEEAGLPEAEPADLTTADGVRLHGWFVPAARPPASFTIVVFNGNAGNRSYRAPLASALRAQGFAVLLFDYRGYGGNDGVPTEEGLAEDARAARAWLVRRGDVDPTRVVYFGESLGSAVAVRLAVEHPPAALVLRSPFTSMADVGQHHYSLLPVRLLLRDRFASIDRVGQIRCPVLVVGGARDRVVPIEQTRRLYDAIAAPKALVVLPEADHNDDVLLSGRETISAVVRFLGALP